MIEKRLFFTIYGLGESMIKHRLESGYTGGAFDMVLFEFGVSSNAQLIKEPVVVQGDRLKIDVARMIVGKYYPVEYEETTWLIRKTKDNIIEFYELVETNE